MAGYVFAIGSNSDPIKTIRSYVEKGVFSTFMNGLAPIPFEGTMADYVSMKPGDNIYFFCKRKFYGIGELVQVGPDCKYCNFRGASKISEFTYKEVKKDLLVDLGEDSNKHRWICTFRGSPNFYETGIDMDEVLTYKPQTFKMIRAFWKVSFIKLGDEENQSLKELFLLRHQNLENNIILAEDKTCHESLAKRDLENYLITPYDMIENLHNNKVLKHEMALEAVVVYDLFNNKIDLLGKWDYISHQVIASPFKPVDYMDKIDVFAIRYLPDTNIPCKYLVIELKKDSASTDAIDQILKYVDWVCKEYAYGDYEAIEACIIASDIPEKVKEHYNSVVKRNYTMGSHPTRNKQWKSLKLLSYAYDKGKIGYFNETPK